MNASNVDHRDVAAYALGVLSDWESEQFEAHLATCDQCAEELEQLTMVSTLLSHVDADSLAVAEQSTQDAQVLDRMLNVVTFERRRSRTRRIFAVAAGIVVLIVGVLSGIAGGGLLQQNDPQAPIAQPSTPGSTPTQRSTPGNTTASPKGNLGITGEQFQATSPTSGVKAKLGLEPKLWGTQVALELSNVRGPLKCQLVAISRNGQNDTAMTWTVTPEGYGTPEQPTALNLEGGTAVQRPDIDRFEVRTADGATLVSVQVS